MPDWKREIRERLASLRLSADDEAELVEELSQEFEQEWIESSRRLGPDEATRLLRDQLAHTNVHDWAIRTAAAPAAPPMAAPLRGRSFWLADLRSDLRFGLRSLRRAPVFTAVAVATLGLGIGATTAVYGVVDAVLVRSLPFAQADQLVRIVPARAGGRVNLSVADFMAVRDRATGLASIATYAALDNGLTFRTGDRPERVYGASVSGDFFKTLGVPALLGRAFTRADELPSSPTELVLSYKFWQDRLGGSPNVIGSSLEVQGSRVPVIGVMPPGFWFPRGDYAEFWMNYRPGAPACECAFTKRVIARLRPGATPERVQAQLDAAAANVRSQFPGGAANWTFAAKPLQEMMVAGLEPVLLVLMAAVMFVLLIACVNVINLLLARATAREGELSVRVALGASRGRLARQLFAETALLAVGGGIVAVAVAHWGLKAILALVPSGTPMLHDAAIGVNGHVLLVAGGCVVLCTLLVGLVPALGVVRRDIGRAIRVSSQSRATHRSVLRDVLVIAEIALALMLVVGAGLMVRSLAKLRAVDTGVRSAGLLTASISLPRTRYGESQRIVDFTDRLVEQLRATPGIQFAAISDGLPPWGVDDQENFLIEGAALPPGGWEPVADHLNVSDSYFATMGIALRSGRLFDARDRDTLASPAIISQRLADRFFPGHSPLGRRMRLSGNHWVTVVGVVGNVAYEGLASDMRLAVYEPFVRVPSWSFSVVARSADPYSVATPLRRIVASLDPGVAVAQLHTAVELDQSASAANSFRAWLLGALAGLALLLAAVGIYGLVSFVTEARTKELGIRVALGAQSRQIVWSVLREALARAALGVAIGAAGAFALRHSLTALVFGVTPTDPTTFAVVSVLLLGVTVVSAWRPARRAAASDPMLVLRSD